MWRASDAGLLCRMHEENRRSLLQEEQADWLAFCAAWEVGVRSLINYIFSDDPQLGQRFVLKLPHRHANRATRIRHRSTQVAGSSTITNRVEEAYRPSL